MSVNVFLRVFTIMKTIFRALCQVLRSPMLLTNWSIRVCLVSSGVSSAAKTAHTYTHTHTNSYAMYLIEDVVNCFYTSHLTYTEYRSYRSFSYRKQLPLRREREREN